MDLAVYRRMETHLRQLGMYPPNFDPCKTMDDVAKACGAEYLTEGLDSLRKIPTGSVDFVWSNAVLSYVRRSQPVRSDSAGAPARSAPGRGSFCMPFQSKTLSAGS